MSEVEIIALTKALQKAVAQAVSEMSHDTSLFPLSTTKRVAQLFGVSSWTVRQWVKTGLLEAHYQQISGRVIRLVFTNRALCRFFDENFPSAADLDLSDFHPKSSRAQRIQKMLSLKKLYARRRQR